MESDQAQLVGPGVLMVKKAKKQINKKGIKEIIVSQETGLLVPPGSPQELKKALVLLINSKALRTQYGEQGYQRIAINFSLSNMINHYIEIFKGIVKDTRTTNHCRTT